MDSTANSTANSVVDLLIVGAGLTALNLGLELSSIEGASSVKILEKSKSCGGRMATRRVRDSRFDHGAQFIERSQNSEKLIDFWQRSRVLSPFPSSDFAAVCGITGMTQLAKKMAESLEILYDTKVTQLKTSEGRWEVGLEQEALCFAKAVVLTCPLPQSLEILDNSKISYNPLLSQIQYSKAIVLLVQVDSSLGPEMVFLQNVDENIFSVCSQKEKGLSSLNEYTIVMQSTWSEDNYSKADDDLLMAARLVLEQKFASNKILIHQIKKWRFCQPIGCWDTLYESPAPGLFLAGDAFGGASLTGTLKSSYALANYIRSPLFSLEHRL